MKYSKQRELILNAVAEHEVHPTADYVYNLLKQDNPNISLGTVYRNLNLLSDNGTIHKISLPNTSDRYDGRMDEHYHMICSQCNEVYDVNLNCLQNLEDQISKQTGFQVTQHNLIINGICKKCNTND